MKTYTVTFKVEHSLDRDILTNGQAIGLEDLIKTAVLPSLNLSLVPLTFTVKNARNLAND
jgi:hypothetical protein